MSTFTVIKHLLYDPSHKLEILGTYSTKLIAIEHIFQDIELLRQSNKFDTYDTLIETEKSSVYVIKKLFGYIYNSKEQYIRYTIHEVTGEVIEA